MSTPASGGKKIGEVKVVTSGAGAAVGGAGGGTKRRGLVNPWRTILLCSEANAWPVMRLGWDVLPLLTSRADIGCAG